MHGSIAEQELDAADVSRAPVLLVGVVLPFAHPDAILQPAARPVTKQAKAAASGPLRAAEKEGLIPVPAVGLLDAGIEGFFAQEDRVRDAVGEVGDFLAHRTVVKC